MMIKIYWIKSRFLCIQQVVLIAVILVKSQQWVPALVLENLIYLQYIGNETLTVTTNITLLILILKLRALFKIFLHINQKPKTC